MARLKWAKMLIAVESTENEQGRVLIRRLPVRPPLRPLNWRHTAFACVHLKLTTSPLTQTYSIRNRRHKLRYSSAVGVDSY